jgi:H+/Cl- antiporter ClcA
LAPPRPEHRLISSGRVKKPRRYLSRQLWQRRLVFFTGALLVGGISVLFTDAANWAQARFVAAVQKELALPLLVTPLGFVVCAWLGKTYFPGAQGSGIPQAIAARHLQAGETRGKLLAPKLIFGKIGLTVLGLLCGASVGREGPTVQVGATIMLQVARLGRLGNERGLILAGAAAGIAAAFNAPLAGIVFAIEEMSRSFEQRTNGLVLYAVIFAGLTSLGLVGNYTYFGTTSAAVTGPQDWALVVLCGIGGGLIGGGFSRLLLAGTARARNFVATATQRSALLLPLACGAIVALAGIATRGATFGTGYAQARGAVEGHALALTFWPAKFIATLATALSGIPGGIFAPSLAVGAGLGSFLATLSGTGTVSLGAVLGMAGYFAGVVQAPMTAFVIILEMTGNNANVIPLMLASVIGYAASKTIAPEPLYHGLAKGFLPTTEARPETDIKDPPPTPPPAPSSSPAPTVATH